MNNMNCICSGKRLKVNDHIWSSDSITIKDKKIMSIEGEVPCGYENYDFELKIEVEYCPICGRKL